MESASRFTHTTHRPWSCARRRADLLLFWPSAKQHRELQVRDWPCVSRSGPTGVALNRSVRQYGPNISGTNALGSFPNILTSTPPGALLSRLIPRPDEPIPPITTISEINARNKFFTQPEGTPLSRFDTLTIRPAGYLWTNQTITPPRDSGRSVTMRLTTLQMPF